jgi:hypothetical protein
LYYFLLVMVKILVQAYLTQKMLYNYRYCYSTHMHGRGKCCVFTTVMSMYELIPLYIPQQYLALKVMRELVVYVLWKIRRRS